MVITTYNKKINNKVLACTGYKMKRSRQEVKRIVCNTDKMKTATNLEIQILNQYL